MEIPMATALKFRRSRALRSGTSKPDNLMIQAAGDDEITMLSLICSL
jgi:hypothetical protein